MIEGSLERQLDNTGAAAPRFPAQTDAPVLRTRLGQISWINCLPVVLPLEHGYVPVSADITYGSPAELNYAYSRGLLDVGAMSSFFYLANERSLDLVPGVSISCKGPVGSVLLFTRRGLSSLAGTVLSVPGSSATSVNLLRALFLEDFGFSPEFRIEASPDPADESLAGALVIGDRALAVEALWSQSYLRTDLGDWWLRRFELPMVFGLWAARKQWCQHQRHEAEAVSSALAQAVSLGMGPLFPRVLAEAQKRTGLAAGRLDKYYRRELSFRLEEPHLRGLKAFGDLCRKHGLIG